MMRKIAMNVFAFGAALAVLTACGGVQDKVGRMITTGKNFPERVKVSERFGFDPSDSTKYLQAALDSGLPEIVIDAKGSPWITRPLFAKSSQRIVFEKGTVLLAKRGEFRERHDSLLTVLDCRNVEIVGNGAVLRMWREDYAHGKDRKGRDYRRGEWRHALVIKGSQNVSVDGLVLEESGGDGIYIAETKELSRDVTIRNCVCDRNHRQGLSIASGENILIENCVFKNTRGTPPEDGVDIEPNRASGHCVNIVLRNCLSENNWGKGFEAAMTKSRTETQVSIRFENCRSVGDRWGAKIRTGVWPWVGDYPTGSIVYDGCSFEKTAFEAVNVMQVPEKAFKVRFDNCRFERVGEKSPDVPLVVLSSLFGDDPPPALPEMKNMQWPDRGGRKFCEYDTFNFAALGEETLPVKPVDPSAARVVDAEPGKFVQLASLAIRRFARYHVYADRARDVHLTARQVVIGASGPATGTVEVVSADGNTVASLEMPGCQESELVFAAPKPGFYSLSFDSGPNAVVLTAADAPIAIEAARRNPRMRIMKQILNAYDVNARLYVPVPAGELAEFRMSGAHTGMLNDTPRRLSVSISHPDGRILYRNPSFISAKHFVTEPQKEDAVLELGLQSLDGGDSYLELAGTSPLLFLTREKFWYPGRLTDDGFWSEPRIIFQGDDKTAYRDPAAVFFGGRCHLFFTLVETEDDQSVHSYVAHSESPDLVTWSRPVKITPRSDRDYSSPGNVVKAGDKWVLCFQSYPRPGNRNDGIVRYADSTARLFVARSKDLRNWSAPELLKVKGPDVFEEKMGRMIDPYLIQDGKGEWWCFYKEKVESVSGVSMSRSANLRDWKPAGRTNGGENVCVVKDRDGYLMMHSPQYGMKFKRSTDLTNWEDVPGWLTLGGKSRPWSKGRLTAGAFLDGRDVAGCGKWILFFHGSGPKTEAEGDFDRNASIALSMQR